MVALPEAFCLQLLRKVSAFRDSGTSTHLSELSAGTWLP